MTINDLTQSLSETKKAIQDAACDMQTLINSVVTFIEENPDFPKMFLEEGTKSKINHCRKHAEEALSPLQTYIDIISTQMGYLDLYNRMEANVKLLNNPCIPMASLLCYLDSNGSQNLKDSLVDSDTDVEKIREEYNSLRYYLHTKSINKKGFAERFTGGNESLIQCKKLNNELKHLEIGSSIKFGEYWSRDGSVMKEPIEWQVLDILNGQALLISTYIIDELQYGSKSLMLGWESSKLRQWLNEDFLLNSFSSYERDFLVMSNVDRDSNPEYLTKAGHSTTDYAFVLSNKEVRKYLSTASKRICMQTDYAQKKVQCEADIINGNWWLRTPGLDADQAMIVRENGSINNLGCDIQSISGVRPAVWININ